MQKRKVILLVDDSNLVLQMEKSILQTERFELATASTGQEALDYVFEHRPSLILLDYILPDMKGDEVTKRIRENPEAANTSIIIVTVMGDDAQKESCFRAGCNDFVTKPINPSTLKLKVDRLIHIAPRIPYRILVKVSSVSKGDSEFVFGSSINLSETGLLVETEKHFDLGEEVNLQFYLTSTREPVQGKGVVVRGSVEGFRKTRAYGINFEDMNAGDMAKIQSFIDKKRDALG